MERCRQCKHRNKVFNYCKVNKTGKLPVPCEMISQCSSFEPIEKKEEKSKN